MFRITRFKREVKLEKLKIFDKMKNEQDQTKWNDLKQRYDTYDQMVNPNGRVSKDTIVSGIISMASILLVLHYEKLDIITTKAFQWIRPKKF